MSQDQNPAKATILHNDRALQQEGYDSEHESSTYREDPNQVPNLWFNSFPHIIWLTDAQGSVTYLNHHWSHLTGTNPQDCLGWQFFQWAHPLDRDRVLHQWHQAIKTQQPFEAELRLKLANGDYRSMVAKASPVHSQLQASQTAIRWIGTLTDLPSPAKTETTLELEREVAQRTAQLAASNQRYIALSKVSPVGIFRTGHLGEYLYVNDRWCQLAGLEPEQAYGFGWSQTIHPDDRESVIQAWSNIIQTNNPLQLEYRFQHPNGELTWVFAQVTPEKDAAGNALGYLGTITDITDIKESEEALRESEERFRATFEQAPIGVAQVDISGHWLRVNHKLCDILGYTREELFETTFQAITHPDDLEADFKLVNQLLLGETSGGSLEKRYIHKDGSWVWVNVTVSLIRNPDGTPKYFVGIVEDIHERKKIEAERRQADRILQERANELAQLNALLATTATLLEERNRELDQFAYVASHDLKAPLRAIANLSEWIEEDLAGQLPEENQQQMKLLRGRVHRMEALINGLLQYSRIGRTKTIIEPINVAEMLDEIIDSLDPPETFTIEVAPQMPTFTTRSLLLRQVLTNLLSNAIKHHNRSDGRVMVSVTDRGSEYEFSVSDDGPGIASDFHDRIFVIFQTLHSRDAKENTGVGLSIVKKIVETEGGQIKIESQVGQGTTFRFTWLKHTKPSIQGLLEDQDAANNHSL